MQDAIIKIFEKSFIDKANKVRREGDEMVADWLLILAKRCSNDTNFISQLVMDHNKFNIAKKTMCPSVYVDSLSEVITDAINNKEFKLNFDKCKTQ